MSMKQATKTLAYWLLPAAINDAIRAYGYRTLLSHVRRRPLLRELARNRRLLNKHRGERCFVLANGPSVLRQDLLPLRREIVLSVSNGYLHRHFEEIQPAYHFVPSITYGKMSQSDCVQWFTEMDQRIGNAEVFVASSEFDLIRENALFPGRSVNYFHSTRQFRPKERRIIDLTGPVPGIITVPIMCCIVAMYMGFSDIYLIGTEHDTIVTREYKYAFEPTVVKGKDVWVSGDGKSLGSMYEELQGSLLIWEQYRHVKRIAQANGVRIWNATAGGILDEFPRVDLAEVLQTRKDS